jgi:hypothetical protein
MIDAFSGHVSETDLVRILTSEQGSAGGAAATGVVELGQANPFGGEGVEDWGLDFSSETTEIAEAEIIGEDVENVGFLRGLNG